ncbi:hypothetical protein MNBD_UNCLBAC01-544 [hydrothermal vent metagenome]|uniref:DNA-directed RNA polymerase n=1 Tax=hydrothermal vent metagenome TaxID=652676 RepID=A0A3B1DYH5_9ZZZZ
MDKAIESLLPKSDWSIYRLVRMAAQRTLELSDGRPSLIDHPKDEKLATIALQEIAEGKLVFKDVADQFAPEAKEGEGKSDDNTDEEEL